MEGDVLFQNPEDADPRERAALAMLLPIAIREELQFGKSDKGVIYQNGERRHATVPCAHQILSHILIRSRFDTPGATVYVVEVHIPLRYKMGQSDIHRMEIQVSIAKQVQASPSEWQGGDEPPIMANLVEDAERPESKVRSIATATLIGIGAILAIVVAHPSVVTRFRDNMQKLIDNIVQCLPQCPF